MPSQRPYFLSSFLAAFRPQGPSLSTSSQQPNKHSHSHSHAHSQTASASTASASSARASATASAQSPTNVAIHSPRGAPAAGNVATSPGAGIPIPSSSSRRRGSDSSSEGFREVLGADKWYIGGRTPGGEEKFFKMGVIRRVRSNDGLSLDRLSL